MQSRATAIFVLSQPVMVCAGFVLPVIKLATQFVAKLHSGFHTVYCCKFGNCLLGIAPWRHMKDCRYSFTLRPHYLQRI